MPRATSPFKTDNWQKPPIPITYAVALPTLYEALSAEERALVRQRYTKIQKGLCSHCGASLEEPPAEEIFSHRIDWNLFPEGFLNHPIHLHHSQEDGLTRGVVHALCNAVLWQFHGE